MSSVGGNVDSGAGDGAGGVGDGKGGGAMGGSSGGKRLRDDEGNDAPAQKKARGDGKSEPYRRAPPYACNHARTQPNTQTSDGEEARRAPNDGRLGGWGDGRRGVCHQWGLVTSVLNYTQLTLVLP